MIRITSVRDFGAAVVVLALAVVFLFWTFTVPPRAAAMPKLVAWLTIVLGLVDVVAQTQTTAGQWLRRVVSAQNVIEWKAQGDSQEAGFGRIVMSIVWVVGYLAGVYLVGFLLTTPVYVFLYTFLHGGKSLRVGMLSAAITTLGIWLTFEIAFKYPLYQGVLFGGY